MNTQKSAGRPPIARDRRRVTVTLPESVCTIYEEYGRLCGVSLASVIREHCIASLPAIESGIKAFYLIEQGKTDSASGLTAQMIAKAKAISDDAQLNLEDHVRKKSG